MTRVVFGVGAATTQTRRGARVNQRSQARFSFADNRSAGGMLRGACALLDRQIEAQAWDVALQIAALREQAGLSQQQLAAALKTSQQQISRLESPGYEGHSLSMLRRVAKVLHACVRVVLAPETESAASTKVAKPPASYGARRSGRTSA